MHINYRATMEVMHTAHKTFFEKSFIIIIVNCCIISFCVHNNQQWHPSYPAQWKNCTDKRFNRIFPIIGKELWDSIVLFTETFMCFVIFCPLHCCFEQGFDNVPLVIVVNKWRPSECFPVWFWFVYDRSIVPSIEFEMVTI